MHRRRAFTLVELLVVIALIGVLAALLLSALSSAQQRARATQTTATMEAFAAACETFFQDHGEYPGVVPDALLMANLDNNGVPPISSLENALYHLMGGYIIANNSNDNLYQQFNGQEVVFSPTFRIKFANNAEQIGNGPIIGGRQYPSYFTPPEGTLIKAFGQVGGGPNLLDITDAWGQPLILLRKQRTIGLLPNNSNPDSPDGNPSSWQFRTEGIAPYVESNNLGDLRRQQQFIDIPRSDPEEGQPSSVLSRAGDNQSSYNGNIGRLLANSAIQDTSGLFAQARGAMLLISSGPDGIYFSTWDGPGSPSKPVFNWEDIDANQAGNQPLTEAALGEYDDILRFIGS